MESNSIPSNRLKSPFLPNDLWAEVFKYLNVNEVCSSSLVATSWRDSSLAGRVWKKLHYERWGAPICKSNDIPLTVKFHSWKRFYQDHAKVEAHTIAQDFDTHELNTLTDTSQSSQGIESFRFVDGMLTHPLCLHENPFADHTKVTCLAGTNKNRVLRWEWKELPNGDFMEPKYVNSYDLSSSLQSSPHCIQMNNDNIVIGCYGDVGSLNGKIYVYPSRISPQVQPSPILVTGPKQDIGCLQQRGHQVVVGTSMGQLELWDLQQNAKVVEFNGQDPDSFSSVQWDDEKVIATTPSTIYIYDVKTGKLISDKIDSLYDSMNIRPHQLQYNNDIIAVSDGPAVAVFDLKKLSLLYEVNHRVFSSVIHFKFDNYKLLSLGSDSTLKVWNLHNGNPISSITTSFMSSPTCFDFTWSKIALGCSDGVVRVLDLLNPSPVFGMTKSKPPRGKSSSDVFFEAACKHHRPEFFSNDSHPNNEASLLMKDMKFLFENSNSFYSDVTFAVGSSRIPAHRNILAIRSDYFKQLFKTIDPDDENPIIPIKDITPPAFEALLQFCYYGQIWRITYDIAIELLDHATTYKMSGLISTAEKTLILHISTDTAVDLLAAAYKYKVIRLKERCVSFILQNITAVSQTLSFKEISKELLVDLLTQANLRVSGSSLPFSHSFG